MLARDRSRTHEEGGDPQVALVIVDIGLLEVQLVFDSLPAEYDGLDWGELEV